jgi:dihydroorotate dehydrogenase
MAAGFDKDGEVPDALLRLGFGFAEVGSSPPAPARQPAPAPVPAGGGPRGHQPHGLQQWRGRGGRRRLRARARGQPGIVGINIGANKDAADRIADYATARGCCASGLLSGGQCSSPNTPGLRALQETPAR